MRRLRPAGREAELITVLLGVLLAFASLRDVYPNAAPDYHAEIMPALEGLRSGGLRGWIEALPGYPAAAMAELPVLWLAELLDLDEGSSWRLLSSVAIGAMVVAVLAALPLLRAARASRTATLIAVALAVASPTAYWALRIGHPEEVLSAALLLGAVVAAGLQRPVLAGVLLGLASGKGWAIAAALPVLGLLLPDRRRVLLAALAAAGAAAVIYLPPFVIAPASLQVMADTGTAAIWNVGHVFWWFGEPIPMAIVEQQPVPQPRIGVTWAGTISHPLILGVGTALGLVWCAGAAQRAKTIASATLSARAELVSSALLVMAGALVARCYLDTWNVPYYLLPAFVCGAIGEAMRGRVPVMTLVATGLMWEFHPPSDPSVRTEPDVYTALYLAWTVPLSLGYLRLGFQTLRPGSAQRK